MAARLVLLLTGRTIAPALLSIILATIILLTYTTGHAQSFELNLDDYRDLHTDLPWDTLRVPIDRLYLGEYHSVPNFLATDFARERVIQESSVHSDVVLTYRVPLTQPFRSEEVHDGAFIVMTQRAVDAQGVEVSVETLDEIAERRRKESLDSTWRTTVVQSINVQDEETETRTGLLNITIPVPLPGAVEKLIGQGEKTRIDISGRESITFSGETRRVSPYYGVEGQQKQPLFPSLDMRQELDIRLQGQIGEKINVQVDHSSSSLAEGSNRINLNYQAFEDDIIKTIELGNTNLSLPGSQMVGFSTSSKGLFGIKTLAQLGPMDLTVIASKEEGEASRASFSPRGGTTIGQTEERIIEDLNFIANKYFFLDLPALIAADPLIRPQEGLIDVYRSVPDWKAGGLANTTYGTAYVDSFGNGAGIGFGKDYERRQFELLTAGDDYGFVLDAETQDINGIELVRTLSKSEVLAVAFVNQRGDTIADYGLPLSQDEVAPLRLKLIWPSDPLPTGRFGFTWPLMMRNIYNLGLSNIDESTLELEILEISNRLNPTTPDSSSVPWIRIFGLDRTDETGLGPPDNRVDLLTGVVNVEQGLITFPDLTPFDPDSSLVYDWTIDHPDGPFEFTGPFAKLKNPELYTELPTSINIKSRFKIVVRAASTTRTFTIDAFNINEGSEVVKLDGRTLQPNRDYTIDYATGEVELTGDVVEELTPSSNITVDYEFKPFAGGASSTLLGFNSILNLAGNSRIGTTWLYESKSSATRRPRLGEEPTRAIAGGLDANLQYEPRFLTSLVNLLPLVDTDASSSLSLSGGAALSVPDPNTRGQAYIDDMEGVEDSDVFSMTRRTWHLASPPVDPDPDVEGTLPSDKREKFFWYNIEPERGVHRRDLNPDLDQRESTLVPSLTIEFDRIPEDSTAWGGVMTGFRGGLDLSQGQFIEIWVNDFQPEALRSGVLRVDMGFIDEDFYEPDVGEFNNEDSNRDGFTVGNEDTGLDGIPTGQPGDDPDDDYISSRITEDGDRFTRINGTEGNGLLDSEDIDGSTQLDETNAYFSFTVDLSDSAVIDIRRDFPDFLDFTDDLDQWRMYRVDLDDYVETGPGGRPAIQQIKHLRLWITDIGNTVNAARKRIQVAEFKAVGNRWEHDGVRASSDSLIAVPDTLGARFKLGVISNKTDPGRYIPPFQPNIQNDIPEKEQSLLLKYDDLEPGMVFRIRKGFAGGGVDFSTYRDLNFLVHTDELNDDLEFYFRVAFDSLTFYEVGVPLTPRYFSGNNWSRVVVALNDLTDLKFLPRDSVVVGEAHDLVDPGKAYTVRMVGKPGQPTLFNVRFLYAGLRYTGASDQGKVSGELWFDEIYLGNRKRDIDFAQRMSTSVSLGNVISLNASYQRMGPDYVRFGERRSAGNDVRALALSAKTNVDYFIPLFGFKVPVTGNFSRNTNLPKFMPGSDTELTDPAVRDSMKSESSVRGFSTTLTRSGSKNPLLKYTFDKLRTNFSASQSRTETPSAADTTTSMSGTADYSITFGQHRLRLFKDFGIRYMPNSFSYRLNATRTKGQRYRNVGGEFVPDPLSWNAGMTQGGSVSYVPFPSFTSSFRMNTVRDLKLPHEWMGVDIGTEVRRSQAFQANYKPPPIWLIGAFSPDLNYGSGYSEDSSPNIRKAGDPASVRNVSSNRDVSVKMRFDLGGYVGKVFDFIGLKEKGDGTSKQGQGARPPPESRGQNGTEAVSPEPDSTDAKPKVDPLLAVRKAAGILRSIRKINASAQHRQTTAYSRVPGKPSLAYQFGFTANSGVAHDGESYNNPETITESLGFTADSGVQLTRNIDVAARFNHSTSVRTFRASEQQSTVIRWPDLSMSWTGLENFGLFRGLFTASSATLTYDKSRSESGRGAGVETITENTAITPSMVFQWKNGIGSTVGVQYGKNLTDARGSATENTNLSVNLDMRYSFEPGKAIRVPLPFLRNKALKSRLETSVGAGFTRTGGRRSTAVPGRFVPLPGSTTLSLSPRVTYNFSRALNGSFFIDLSRSHNDSTDQTTTVVRVGITATFTF